jgi:hypothetical protein
MDFLTQQKELGQFAGLDYTVTEEATLLKRWINTAQQNVAREYDWPFLRASTPLVVKTVADYTTGTCTTTAGSQSITFSGTITPSKADQYIRTASSGDWYRISSHSALSSSATLVESAIYDATAVAFTIRKFYYSAYSASVPVDRILSIRQSISPAKLQEVSKEQFDELEPDPDATGTPRVFMVAGFDDTKVPQFVLWPTPDAVIHLYVEYLQQLVDLSADADVSIIPEKFHRSVLMTAAQIEACKALNDDRVGDMVKLFDYEMTKMKGQYEISKSRIRRIRTIDQGEGRSLVPFPSTYPAPYGN